MGEQSELTGTVTSGVTSRWQLLQTVRRQQSCAAVFSEAGPPLDPGRSAKSKAIRFSTRRPYSCQQMSATSRRSVRQSAHRSSQCRERSRR